ncbi:enoyl-CoA hydratase/isomerase family protein [Croceicoccus sp. YJ47]|uniref:enoyl-CoA hydratase/isomerase family protein n=1 Tax=Croceicoccus sp. YJ47 TaxID=2798724 RepID=UPI001924ED55|nr:enoyl-CoA hydratase-related protein [Croceicoccus sp. YJ47]QQN75276.1 enoyl-CoA hydratase/isomerase family protein [Croceicoccus sp. YJ47]
MTDNAELLTDIADGVATLTFNRPEVRNALSPDMVVGIQSFLAECERRDDVRCIVMTGAGDHFMAGGDVKGFAGAIDAPPVERAPDFERRARSAMPIFTLLERMPKPVVAKVRGAVAGASVGWVAASDFVIAADTSIFIVAHIALGTSPDGAVTWHLPRMVGLRRAKEMCILGDRMSASEALAAGLVNRVVAEADVDTETERLVRRLANGPTAAIGATKLLLNGALSRSQAAQMELEAESFAACSVTQDFEEGIRSFIEKRKPAFGGR